jgi:hypothetical protein
MLIRPRADIHTPLPDGRTHPSIDVGKLYIVVSVVMDDVRIVNDEGEPILVPRSLFEVLDSWIPDDWIRESGEEGWSWCGPPQCAVRGFFERWHEGHLRERQVFADVYVRLWRHYERQLVDQKLVLVA